MMKMTTFFIFRDLLLLVLLNVVLLIKLVGIHMRVLLVILFLGRFLLLVLMVLCWLLK
jgi:hypothetical protein